MTEVQTSYNIAGLMSGSSLDGLDIAFCKLSKQNENWSYEFLHTITIPFPKKVTEILTSLSESSGIEAIESADNYFGSWMADTIENEISKHPEYLLDAIVSHGHTIYHRPDKGITLQIGSGQIMANTTGIPVINNIRQADVNAGGQGAPLVPITDELLFSEFDCCINIGGISNISFVRNNRRIGFDICAANQLLNALSNQLGLAYDEGGSIAATGKIDTTLLQQLDDIPFLKLSPPKSLDNYTVQEFWIKQCIDAKGLTKDILATATEHIAKQIGSAINESSAQSVLITGGGAYNTTLISGISRYGGIEFKPAAAQLIEYKESLAMALMGALFLRNEVNCIPSVTGALQAVRAGELHLPE